ncbi:flavin reductase family protein [Phreatobacter stygius]|uniref:Flavin reductase family protein n=1 Tax=Phreatobacter stygius TaxID=1940610 RepID=A0A4D7ATV6_9HYPH|nr:flavin reductase family protein [Phreatobacter stygius]QCI65004.1 flavin reductase family protein [Phreatobacter stygius]
MNAFSPLPLAAKALEAGTAPFRDAMRQLAGGVCVITAGIGEDRSGLTATSPTSLSMDPPTILVSINRASSAFPVIASYRHFAVNLLAADQQAVAESFTGKGGLRGAQRYRGAEWTTLQTSAPILEGALAAVDCEVEELIERHSHVIVLGRVVAVRSGAKTSALVYWHGGYDRLEATPAGLSLAAGLAAY